MNLYNVEWDKLNVLLLPTFLRKIRFFAFLKAATMPIWTIYRRFIASRNETLFILKYDTSKGNLERALNRRFETNGIYVVNTALVSDDTVYLSDTSTSLSASDIVYLPVYLGTVVDLAVVDKTYLDDTLYLDFYIDPKKSLADFAIMVPVAVDAIYHDAIVAFAKMFILPGFRFNIIPY